MPRTPITSRILAAVMGVLCLAGCSVEKHLPEDGQLLDAVIIHTDNRAISKEALQPYIRQRANSKWFSLWKIPLHLYTVSRPGGHGEWNQFWRNIGEAPVVLDTTQTHQTTSSILQHVQSMGYLDASVQDTITSHRRKSRVHILVRSQEPYTLEQVHFLTADTLLIPLLKEASETTLLEPGKRLDISLLEEERHRITTLMQNHGYYLFNKDYINFTADTTLHSHRVNLTLNILPFNDSQPTERTPHPLYHFGKVRFLANASAPLAELSELDTVRLDKTDLMTEHGVRLPLRRRTLVDNCHIFEGQTYTEQSVQDTYSSLSALKAVKYCNISLLPQQADSTCLDALIQVHTNEPGNISFEVEGTNSAGDLGAAASLTFQNRNFFHGSELFSLKVRGAFEAIRGLEGYADQNYFEAGGQMSLLLPTLKIPFSKRSQQLKYHSTAEFSVSYNTQDRPEFHRRVLSALWRYRWQKKGAKAQNRLDLIELNYVFMPWISPTFRQEYLEDNDKQNAILRYNYENLFIMKFGYNFTYNSLHGSHYATTSMASAASGGYDRSGYVIRFGVETAGNVLHAFTRALHSQQNSDAAYTLFNIAYAQYAKFDFDWSKSLVLDNRNALGMHIGFGIAYPYGNSSILPYEKRYFSGGANSVRGWAVRELGPGTFSGGDKQIDFINQTGDVKLDISIEYRTFLFWKLNGAFFIDAGNIWTLRNYNEQPGGQFRPSTFWREIAVAYGLGLRFNFNYFILRLDAGMKAINPAYTGRDQYPLIAPRLKRDFAFHFAVGLPF